MRSIKKLKSTGKAVAGSALLVGATLTGAAGLAAAQDSGSSMDLGDYPQPFINEDGEVDSTIVVGEQAKTADVVGAINVAGSLGNAAFEETPISVDISGATASWTASDGVTLNRQNSNLFLEDSIADQTDSVDDSDLEDVLATSEFQLEDGTTVETDFEVMIGDADQEFSTDPDGLEEPALHVGIPARNEVGPNSYALAFMAEMDEEVDFSDTSEDAEVESNTEIELFGQTYTVNREDSADDTLALYGSSQTLSMQDGETSTFTIDGEEHEIELVAVNNQGAAFRVDGGSLRQREDGESVTVDGQEIRVSDVVNLQDDSGYADFSIGSNEVVLEDGSSVEINDDSVDGTHVELSMGDGDSIDGVTVYTGAQDRDNDYLAAGDSYVSPVFNQVELHYGGLAPNAAEDPAETVDVGVSGDEDAEITLTDSEGNEGTITFKNGEADNLGDVDGDIATYEGQEVGIDDYLVLNHGLYQVNDAFYDDSGSEIEGELTLDNVLTGDSVEVDESDMEGDTVEQSIDGVDYNVQFTSGDTVSIERVDASHTAVYQNLNTETDAAVAFTEQTTIEGTNIEDEAISEQASNQTVGTAPSGNQAVHFNFDDIHSQEVTVDFLSGGSQEATTTFQVDSQGVNQVNMSGSEFQFDQVRVNPNQDDANSVNNLNIHYNYSGSGDYNNTGNYDQNHQFTSFSGTGADAGTEFNVELPSTKSSGDYEVTFTDDDSGSVVGSRELSLAVTSVTSGDNTATVAPTYADAGTATGDANIITQPAAHLIEPQDDAEDEHVHTFTASEGDNSDELELDAPMYTEDNSQFESSDFDADDLTGGYTNFGTYYEYDSSDAGEVTVNLPSAQSTAGAAVTEAGGSLSAGAASGDATTQTPTGWPDAAALDSEVSGSDRSQDLILVGGPAVNTLTEELAQDNKTWTQGEYEQDTWVLDLVEGFSEDTHALVVAGHSADDTRAASSFISNYADNAEDLAGETTVSMTTSSSSQ